MNAEQFEQAITGQSNIGIVSIHEQEMKNLIAHIREKGGSEQAGDEGEILRQYYEQ